MNRNFNEIYEEIRKNGIEEIENLKKKRRICAISFIIFLIIFFIVFFNFKTMVNESKKIYEFFITVLALGAISSLVAFVALSIKYEKTFKEKVIKRIVKLYNDKFIYSANMGINRDLYDESHYNHHYNKYYSEDFIKGEIIDNIVLQMSQVRISEETTQKDSEGNETKTETVLFDGLYGIVDFGDIMLSQMDVMSNSTINRFNKHRIEMDSSEFEKDYDMMSKDKIRTMEIFTPEVIDEINKLKESIGSEIQIRILKDKIFFRIQCRDPFEPPALKNAFDYNTLYKYFRMIDAPVTIITQIIENINHTEK